MSAPVFYNRYTRELQEEQVYGEAALRFIYENPLGKLALHALVKRGMFSRWYGWRMNAPASRERIASFIERYGIEMDDFDEPEGGYPHFNAFFARPLAQGARPIDSDERSVVFQADARHLLIPNVSEADDFFIKGQRLDIGKLLEDSELTDRFTGGAMLISRLCPVDYHRFHFPLAGFAGETRLINGALYSVNPLALAKVLGVLWENKRTITVLETEQAGKVLCMEVGATCVGSITQTYMPNSTVAKGEEKGFFTFGGSTTITLFEKGRVCFSDDLIKHSAQGREIYARMGDRAGAVADY